MSVRTWFFNATRSVLVHIFHTLTSAGKIFKEAEAPWRYKGVTAFGLLNRFAKGEDIEPFLKAFEGFNVLRVFWYVTWPGTGWESVDASTVRKFCAYVGQFGFRVELVLLTDDDPNRVRPAINLVNDLRTDSPKNLMLEIGNEPTTHKNIRTETLRGICESSGFPFSSGNYEQSAAHFGTYLTAHTGRDGEWVRRAHDLLEYYQGGGPSDPSDPAHKIPIVADEPPKLEDVGANPKDWRAYFGACALLGAGATFHFESGKYGNPPTDTERVLAAEALAGLDAFPPDAPQGAYSRPEDSSLRTYVVGHYMVRIRPTSLEGVVPGTMLDKDGILWKL